MKANIKTEYDRLFGDLDLFNELDEEIVGLGPRLFDDKYFDESIELDLVKKHGKHKGQSSKTTRDEGQGI